MATKLAVAVAVGLVLFAFVDARTPLDPPGNEVNVENLLVDLQDADPETANAIFLPSEKPESERATAVDLEPESKSESELPKEMSGSETGTEIETVPLKVISYRPMNRWFERRPMIPVRPGHRRCHGRLRRHQFGHWTPRFVGGDGRREISYGNDMIIAGGRGGEDSDTRSDRPTFPRGGPRFPFGHDMAWTEEKMERGFPHWPRHHHHHHRRHHDHHDHDDEDFFRPHHVEGEEGERDHDHEHEHGHEGGFMKGSRKFLNHF